VNDDLPYDDSPDVLIECSCGLRATVAWDGSAYACAEAGWRYHSDPADDARSRLWHCGAKGHRQAKIVACRARPGHRLYSGGRVN
jgi:hypothetical protein